MFLNELIFSPFVYFILALFLFSGFFLFIFRKKQISRSKLLIDYFNGSYKFPFGSLKINYSAKQFRLVRISTGGGQTGVGGSFPKLWTYVNQCPKLIIGNSKCKTYTMGSFLILPPHQIIKIGNAELLIGSNDSNFLEKIKNVLTNNTNFTNELVDFFSEDFAHTTFSSEFHVGGLTLVQKKYVLNCIGLPEKIYQDPKILEAKIKTIVKLADFLGIQFE